MKKRKLTPQQKRLQAEWESMISKHAKPLEKGAKAKSTNHSGSALNRKPVPLLEAGRTNKEKSLDTGYNSTAPKQQIMYSCDKVLGVALMHKSSLVPVFSQQEVLDVSKMRR